MEHLGCDIELNEDLVTLPNGDVSTVHGVANYIQALGVRLATERGDLWSHPEFGARLRRFIKAQNTLMNRMELEQEIVSALEEDPRTIPGTAAAEVRAWDMQNITVRASCQPDGSTNPVNLVITIGSDAVAVDVAEEADAWTGSQ